MTAAIYVASRIKHATMWKQKRKAGAPIISTWIDEAGEGETEDFGELWHRIEGEVKKATALVFYASGYEDFPFKGALVEVGMALAFGKPVYAVIKHVEMEGRTMRPVGSWILSRRVICLRSLSEALLRACHDH